MALLSVSHIACARESQSLVLDLDHTLLNSATYNELDQDSGDKLEAWQAKERGGEGGEGDEGGEGGEGGEDKSAEDAGAGTGASSAAAGEDGGAADASSRPLLHHLRHIHMWTKLRPHVHAFLRAASPMYELYVYTMGARAYAAEMVALLDPDGTLGLRASDRVIGKEDSTASHTKDLDVILGSERTTLIVDDSPAVWPQFASQLLVPRRYHFFPSSAARDGSLPAGTLPHLLTDADEPATDGQLDALLSALTKVHTHYFRALDSAAAAPPDAADDAGAAGESRAAAHPPHVSDSVRAVRRKVLRGVHAVFSHVIPLEQQRTPENHAAWRLASELGAAIHTGTSERITHIIAGSDGTDKVRWAKARGVHAVSIDWLASCGYLWRVAEEGDFPIDGKAHTKGVAPGERLGASSATLPPPDLAAAAAAPGP